MCRDPWKNVAYVFVVDPIAVSHLISFNDFCDGRSLAVQLLFCGHIYIYIYIYIYMCVCVCVCVCVCGLAVVVHLSIFHSIIKTNFVCMIYWVSSSSNKLLMMAKEGYESAWDNSGKIHLPIPTWNQETYQETWKERK